MRIPFTLTMLALFCSIGCNREAQVPPTDVLVEHESHATVLSEATFRPTIESNPVVMIDFWAPWCGPCVQLAPTVEALAVDYEGQAVIAKVNVDDNRQLAAAHGVSSIPTLIFFKDGQEVKRIEGAVPRQDIAAALDALLQ